MSPICSCSGFSGIICIPYAPWSSTGFMLPVGAKRAHCAPWMFISTFSCVTSICSCEIQSCGPIRSAPWSERGELGNCMVLSLSVVAVTSPIVKLSTISAHKPNLILLLCSNYYIKATNL